MEGWARWDLPILLLYEASKKKGKRNDSGRRRHSCLFSFELAPQVVAGGHIRRWLMYARSAALDSHPLPLLAHMCVRARARARVYTQNSRWKTDIPSFPPFPFHSFFPRFCAIVSWELTGRGKGFNSGGQLEQGKRGGKRAK